MEGKKVCGIGFICKYKELDTEGKKVCNRKEGCIYNPYQKKFMKGILILFMGIVIGYISGYQDCKSQLFYRIEWYPRLSWKEYLKETGHENEEITTIYIRHGCLYVGTNSGFLCPNIIKHPFKKKGD